MSMTKIAPVEGAGDHFEIVKASPWSRFGGTDFSAFVKRASHSLADWVRRNPPQPGEVLAHLLALTSTELAGPNRNADGYSRRMLERDHPKFVKLARYYYNHSNRDPARSYGVVKQSFFNPEMERVELIIAINETKEAADRNGGLVDHKTLHRMAAGHGVAVSQATRIPYDVCVACGNRAPNRSHYCGPDQCRKYGGCRDNLGRTFDDGFHLYVDNPHCDFYDISDVSDTRGADRTAFITGKVSVSVQERATGGAELAEQLGLVVPDYVLGPATVSGLRALTKLAAHRPVEHGSTDWSATLSSRGLGAPALPHKQAGSGERHQWASDLARAGLILPPAWWLAAYSNTAVEKAAAYFGQNPLSPRVLADHPERADLVAAYALAPSSRPTQHAYAPTPKSEEKLAWALAAGTVQRKLAAPAAPPAALREVAARYAAYQANALAVHENSPSFPLLLCEAVRHNRFLPW